MNSVPKISRPRKDTSEDVLIDVVAPLLPTDSQGKPPVESVSEPSGIGTKVLIPPSSDIFVGRGRRTQTTVTTKETPETVIDFSPPSVPSYTVHRPVAGGFDDPLWSAHSNRGLGNTATNQHEASSNPIHPWGPTINFTEKYYSTNPVVPNDPLLRTGEDGTTVPGHQFQGHDIGQAELVKNQPPTFCNSSRSDKRASHHPSPYEMRFVVKNNTSYIIPEAVDNPTQATYSLHHSPSPGHVDPDTFESPVYEVICAQPSSANIALDTGPAPRMHNTSLDDVKFVPLSAAPNTVTNNQFLSDLDRFHSAEVSQTSPLANKCDNPSEHIPTSQTPLSEVREAPYYFSNLASQRHAESSQHGSSQLGPKSKVTSHLKDQPTTHIDL